MKISEKFNPSTSLRAGVQSEKLGKGFTLIEVILYVAIVSIFLTSLIPFTWSIVAGGAKNFAQQEVYSQARYVSERIKYEIRNASGITSVSGSSISLTNFSPDTTTVITLSGGKVTINKNGTGAVNLNSNDTIVTGLAFTNYTSGDNKTKHIGFTFNIDDNYQSSRQEFNVPVYTVESSAELRSNTVLN